MAPCTTLVPVSLYAKNAAMSRHYTEDDYGHAARILGVDVAREGDDKSVIFPRQGLVAFPPAVMATLRFSGSKKPSTAVVMLLTCATVPTPSRPTAAPLSCRSPVSGNRLISPRNSATKRLEGRS